MELNERQGFVEEASCNEMEKILNEERQILLKGILEKGENETKDEKVKLILGKKSKKKNTETTIAIIIIPVDYNNN